jgi:hypothetical protein
MQGSAQNSQVTLAAHCYPVGARQRASTTLIIPAAMGAGDLSFDNTDPVLLTIASKRSGAPSEEAEPIPCAICRGQAEAMKFAREHSTGACTMFELATVAHRLSKGLADTEPRRRGRG